MKQTLVHNTSTVRKQSTKLFVGIAAIICFQLYLSDVSQACGQNSEYPMRDVYLNPLDEINLKQSTSPANEPIT